MQVFLQILDLFEKCFLNGPRRLIERLARGGRVLDINPLLKALA